MKISNLEISHGIESVKQPFCFKRKKVILNCKVQSYFGIELLKTTLSEIVEEFSPTLSIIKIEIKKNLIY